MCVFLAKMQKSREEGIYKLDMNLVLKLSVELVPFKTHGHWDHFSRTPFILLLFFSSVYLTHTCNWCRKYWQDMTQKYIQACPSTFTQENSQGFAAEDGSITLDVTGTHTKHPRGLLSSCKRALHGHPGAFYRDGKQSSFSQALPCDGGPDATSPGTCC